MNLEIYYFKLLKKWIVLEASKSINYSHVITPNNTDNIKELSFFGDYMLKKIIITPNIKHLKHSCFAGTTKLKKVCISRNISKMDVCIFGYSGVKKVVYLTEENIPYGCFMFCSNLEEILYLKKPEISDFSFEQCDKVALKHISEICDKVALKHISEK